MQPSAKLRTYIGFCIKMRKIVYGYDSVMRAKGIRLVVASGSINRTAQKELSRYCAQVGVPVQWVDDELLAACTAPGCKCVGLADASLAKAANEEINCMRRGEPNEQ